MKKTISFFSYIFLLGLVCKGCKRPMIADSSNQFNYTYNAESFGYNDIKKLYSFDTVNTKQPFFKSESLQDAEVHIKSLLDITTLEQTTEGKLVCYQLINPSFILKSGGITTDTEFISKDLIKPVFVQIDNYGKIGLITSDSSMTMMATGIFKDIIGRMQFVKPVETSKSWQTIEENTNGTYSANYQISESKSTGNTYNKKIVEYLKYKSERKKQNISIDNKTSIEIDSDGKIKSIHTSEAQVVLYNTDTLSVFGTKVSVFLTSKTNVKNSTKEHLLDIKNSSRYSNQTTLSAPISVEKINQMVHAETLGSDNWQQLLQRLSTPNGLTSEEEDTLVEKFRAIFYLYPETCKKAVTILEKESSETLVSRILRDALSLTETFKATDALADIIDNNKNNDKVLEELLPQLATTAFPTQKAVDIVKSIAFSDQEPKNDFIISTAQLTLGGMAYRLKPIDTLLANNLTKFLMDEMRFEKDTIQQLLVFGNTGSLTVFPFIKPLIENKKTSDQVKVEAISALRHVNNNEVSKYLRKLLLSENEVIKNKAKEVLDYQNTKTN